MQYLQSAAPRSARAPHARAARGTAAVPMTLAAPALSASGALTTGLNGTSPAVGFPPGYGMTLAATVAATTLAAALGALIAGRDALIAIPPHWASGPSPEPASWPPASGSATPA